VRDLQLGLGPPRVNIYGDWRLSAEDVASTIWQIRRVIISQPIPDSYFRAAGSRHPIN